MILICLDQSFITHAAEFFGHGAAIQVQVVCELLTVKGNVKLPALFLQGDAVQVSHDLGSGALRRGMEHAPGEQQILPRRDG